MVIEHRLHDRLAIVEGAFDRERMHVRRTRRRHHPPLHVGNAAVRKQHDQIDIVETRKRIDRGAAGIARGGDHDGGALRAFRQHMIHQPRDQLHRDVLERERRAVKKFEHELAGAGLPQRHHGGMAERRVGFIGHAAEIGIGDFAAGERPDHLDGDFPIRPSEKSGDGLRRKLRPGFRHVEAAVAGKPGQHHVAETQGGGFPPRRNIPRQTALQRPGSRQAFDVYELLPFADDKARGTIKRFWGMGNAATEKRVAFVVPFTVRTVPASRDCHCPALAGHRYAAAFRFVIASNGPWRMRARCQAPRSNPFLRVKQEWIASAQGLLAMTAILNSTASHSRGATTPEVCWKLFALDSQRAQGMPDARCTRGLVRNVHEKVRTRAYRAAEAIRHSLRNGFTAYNALSPVIGFFATVALRIVPPT